MPSPKKAVAFSFDIGLVDQAARPSFKANPTLATGDFKVSKDGGSLTNLATLPTVTPAAGKIVNIDLSSAEMNADIVTIVASDAAGAEWDDVIISINTTVQTVDDLPTAAGVNAEVVDALNVDTYAEIGQETPAATQTLRKMIGYIYKIFRNKKTQTSTTFSLFADDGTTVDQKATVSDDSTTATKGEITSGP